MGQHRAMNLVLPFVAALALLLAPHPPVAAETLKAVTVARGLANPWALTELCRDKLRCQRFLEEAGLELPPVEANPDRFAARLETWGAGFLKPRFGALGAGVRCVRPGDPLPATLPGLQGLAEPALLQRAVPPPAGLAGMSLRLLAQRAPDGTWEEAPVVLRQSREDPVVNAARGAELALADQALSPMTRAAVSRLAQAACRAFAAGPDGQHALELGLDLGIDQAGQPWLIEVNGRPQGRLEHLARGAPALAALHLETCLRPLRTLAAWAE